MAKAMQRLVVISVALVLAASMSGCVTYAKNRGSDFVDIFDLSVGVCLFTEDIRVPQLYLSAQGTRCGHLAVGTCAVGRFGLYGGSWHAWTESNSALPVAPFVYFSESSGSGDPQAEEFWQYDLFDRWDRFLGLPSNYRDIWTPEIDDAVVGVTMDSPTHWFDLSLEGACVLPSVRAGISPGELVDFVAGVFFLDPAGDDEVSGDDIAGHLKELLAQAEKGGWGARRKALMAAHRYRPHPAAWDVFHAAFRWEELRLRGMAYFLMTEGGWPDSDTLPIFIRLLKDADARLRMNALGHLGAMGRSADIAIPALVPILDRADRSAERGLAAKAIGDIAVACADARFCVMAAEALGRHLGDVEEGVRIHCEAGLESLKERAAPATPSIVLELGSEDATRRYTALKLLGRIGPAASDALPSVRRALNDKSASVRGAAAWAIRRIER